MQYLYIHTDEQTAVFVIADDKISTIYLTRHQYFSYLKLFAAKCQCLRSLSTVFNVLHIILHVLTSFIDLNNDLWFVQQANNERGHVP